MTLYEDINQMLKDLAQKPVVTLCILAMIGLVMMASAFGAAYLGTKATNLVDAERTSREREIAEQLQFEALNAFVAWPVDSQEEYRKHARILFGKRGTSGGSLAKLEILNGFTHPVSVRAMIVGLDKDHFDIYDSDSKTAIIFQIGPSASRRLYISADPIADTAKPWEATLVFGLEKAVAADGTLVNGWSGREGTYNNKIALIPPSPDSIGR